jgi:hypothetical protein
MLSLLARDELETDLRQPLSQYMIQLKRASEVLYAFSRPSASLRLYIISKSAQA